METTEKKRTRLTLLHLLHLLLNTEPLVRTEHVQRVDVIAGHPLVAGDADVRLVGLDREVLSDGSRPVADERVGRLEVRVIPEERDEQVVERALGRRKRLW